MIERVRRNIEALEGEPEYSSVYGGAAFQSLFEYLAIAEQEALLRFPEDALALQWRWDLNFNLANAFSLPEDFKSRGLNAYAVSIRDALNSGEVTIGSLEAYLQEKEPRLAFETTSYPTPSGYESAHLVKITNSAYLALLERGGRFEAYGLVSSMLFFREVNASHQLLDLTGDRYPELVLTLGRSYCCGAFTSIFVFDLSQGNPRRLDVFYEWRVREAPLRSEFESEVFPLGEDAEPGFVYQGNFLAEVPCGLKFNEKYYWNGLGFELAERWLTGEFDGSDRLCPFASDNAEERAAMSAVFPILEERSIFFDTEFFEFLLFRVGEYWARGGNEAKAASYFNMLTELGGQEAGNPSYWGQSARTFLEEYPEPRAFYPFCSRHAFCDLQTALHDLIDGLGGLEFVTVVDSLKEKGVAVERSGYYDFLSYGSRDQWIIVRDPRTNECEFWILIKEGEDLHALFVARIPGGFPSIREYVGNPGESIFSLDGVDGTVVFEIEWSPRFQKPLLYFHVPFDPGEPVQGDPSMQPPDLEEIDSTIVEAQSSLFAGADPLAILDLLAALQDREAFDCDRLSECDRLYYLAGLSAELSGDEGLAIEYYLRLWDAYPDSLFTVMARSRIDLDQ